MKKEGAKRDPSAFRVNVTCGMPTYAALADVRFDLTFFDLDAIVEAYTVGRPRALEMFGPDVSYGGPGWSGISYGHVNGLGCPLLFPEDSEVAHTPIYTSIEEAVQRVAEPVDWAAAGRMPYYLDLWGRLKAALPDETIPFGGLSYEGPVTTAWALRGHDFFTDVHDEPDMCEEFLRRITDSMLDYLRFLRRTNGHPESGGGSFFADDISAMLAPALWPGMVLPVFKQFFEGCAAVSRGCHIENLRPPHLPYLDELDLDAFDPSVSPNITPADVRDLCSVPFDWMLTPMDLLAFDEPQVRQFVVDVAAQGASVISTHLQRDTIGVRMAQKIHAFTETGHEVTELVKEGCARDDLPRRMGSPGA